MPDTQYPLLHTITDAAELLQVSRGSIYNMVTRRELELVKLGKSARITHRSIIARIDRPAAEQAEKAGR